MTGHVNNAGVSYYENPYGAAQALLAKESGGQYRQSTIASTYLQMDPAVAAQASTMLSGWADYESGEHLNAAQFY